MFNANREPPQSRGRLYSYALGYVLDEEQVSKVNPSVKNGGYDWQINVEYVKPEDETAWALYGSTMGKFEANAMVIFISMGNKNLSMELAHLE